MAQQTPTGKKPSIFKTVLEWFKSITAFMKTARDILKKVNMTIVIISAVIGVAVAGYQGYQEYKKLRKFVDKLEGYVDEYKAKADALEQDYNELRQRLRSLEVDVKGKVQETKEQLQQQEQELKDKIDERKDALKQKEQDLKDDADSLKEKFNKWKK